MMVGKAMDEAISGILNGKFSIDDADSYIKLWSSFGNEAIDEEYTADNLSRVLREWYDRHLSPESRPENRFPFDKLYAVQKPFELPIGQLRVGRRYGPRGEEIPAGNIDVSSIGVIDWIGETADWLWVVDLKTTRKNLDERFRLSFELAPQMPSYVHAAKHMMEKPVRGAYIAAIQLRQLPTSEGRCAKHSPCSHSGRKDERCPRCVLYTECGSLHLVDDFFMVNLPYNSEARWKRRTMEAARDYYRLITTYPTLEDLPKARAQGADVYDACINCEFRSFCWNDRPIDRIDEYLVQRVPEEGHVKSGLYE